jgi:hypothetical protein
MVEILDDTPALAGCSNLFPYMRGVDSLGPRRRTTLLCKAGAAPLAVPHVWQGHAGPPARSPRSGPHVPARGLQRPPVEAHLPYEKMKAPP